MFSTQRFPSANDKWEDKYPAYKTWEEWKTHFKSAEKKANVSRAALGTQDQPGAAHGAGLLVPPDNRKVDGFHKPDSFFRISEEKSQTSGSVENMFVTGGYL